MSLVRIVVICVIKGADNMPSTTSTSPSSATFPKRMINLLLPLLLIALAISNSTSRLREMSEPVSMASTIPLVQVEAAGVPKGLTANDWAGIKGEYERHRHAAFAVASEHRARNYAQQWLAHFDGRGFTVNPHYANWKWGLELKSYGFAGNERVAQGKAEVKSAVERVTYKWSDELEEWFVNERRGLKHGFTLKQRPLRDDRDISPLRLHLAVRGGLKARVQDDGQGVSFTGANGAAAINYNGLKVWDADKKEVKARMSAEGDEVCLAVEESEARYPLTIDPIVQQVYLKASNTGASDNFGFSVAISGETIVVGAPFEESSSSGVNQDGSDNSALFAGAAYVFVRNGGTWT
jgi:hypothetical protein